MIRPIDAIQRTLDMYNPSRHGVLVGTSAIHWAISSRNADSATLGLRDVDILVTEAESIAIYKGLPTNNVKTARFVSEDASRLIVTPTDHAAHLGTLIFDVISDNGGYEDPLIFNKFRERIFANDLNIQPYIKEFKGVRFVDLPFIFWWKASIGRESDMDTLHKTIVLLHDQNAFGSSSPSILFRAIELGRVGLRL